MATTVLMILLLAGATQLPPDAASRISESLSEACAPLLPSQRPSNERNASTALKTLTSAQADFRANDRDGDGVNQFWRADVAGLYTVAPRGGLPIQLIAPATAMADDRPRVALPWAVQKPISGYWIRAIRHADENPKALDPNRFAFVAYPARLSSGKYMFIIDENNSIFRCPVEGNDVPDVFPTDEEFKARWSRV